MKSLAKSKLNGLFLTVLFCMKLRFQHVASSTAPSAKWKKVPVFDNRLAQTGNNVISKSRIHCADLCSIDSTCTSFFYIPSQNINCQLHTYILQPEDDLQYVQNASYYIMDEVITAPPFSCPLDDTIFRTVTVEDGTLFTYMVVKQTKSQADAKSHCEGIGGFLTRVTTVAKMNMLLELVACSGYSGSDYYVDGSNADAQDYEANGAWVMANGDPVPMTTDFWDNGCPNNPSTEHCFRMRVGSGYKWDDCNCGQTKYFICEKTNNNNNINI